MPLSPFQLPKQNLTEWMTYNKHQFLTVLEPGKFKLVVLVVSMSDEGLLLPT